MAWLLLVIDDVYFPFYSIPQKNYNNDISPHMYFSFRDGPKENLLRGQRSYRKKMVEGKITVLLRKNIM